MNDHAIPNQPPETELERLRRQADEHLAGWQRAKADYLNLKKQTEKDREETIQFANAALLLQLLPIYDHFKRALEHTPREAKETEWVKGIGHIRSQFQNFFRSLGIEEIQTENQPFDPARHEAVSHEAVPGVAPDRILQELSTGFTFGGKVLVPAKVKVSAEATNDPNRKEVTK